VRNRRAQRFRHVVNLLVWVLILRAGSAFAHSFDPAVLDLHERDLGIFDAVWKAPPAMPGASAAGRAPLFPDLPAHCRRVTVAGAADPGDGEPVSWRVDCRPGGLRGGRVAVNGLDGTKMDVIVRITWRDGQTVTGVLRSGADQMVVPSAVTAHGLAASAPSLVVVERYGRAGIEHFLLDFDHLLFVLGLLLLVQGGGKLVKTITAFTVGHSLALALAVLDVVTVPTAPVGALIAASIVFVALELTRSPEAPHTMSRRYPWAVAFAFGLLHGLGFADALAQIGLPANAAAWAVLGFNLGVEAGQLAFVLALLAPLAVWTRFATRWTPVRFVPAYAIGTLATAGVLEQVWQFWSHSL
jgi:hypothetical protein